MFLGFLGKVLVEKLLRDCEKINLLYLLIRNKKGLSANDRLRSFKDHQVSSLEIFIWKFWLSLPQPTSYSSILTKKIFFFSKKLLRTLYLIGSALLAYALNLFENLIISVLKIEICEILPKRKKLTLTARKYFVINFAVIFAESVCFRGVIFTFYYLCITLSLMGIEVFCFWGKFF